MHGIARTQEMLAADPVFAGMAEEDLRTLAGLVVYREYPKGAVIIEKEEPDPATYRLLSGRAKVGIVSSEGKELALSYLEAPAYFGGAGAAQGLPHVADVVAATDVEVLSIDAKDLPTVIRMRPEFAISLIMMLSAQIRELSIRLEGMAFHDAAHRVTRVLLNVATASYESRGVPVIEGLTHYEIATLAGTSRETASRVISNLQRDGVAATKGRKIVIDLFALRDLIERNR